MIIVKPCDDGWLVINKTKAIKFGWENAHTHIRTKRMAYRIKKNVEQNRMPKTRNGYLLESHIRVTMNDRYRDKIQQLIDTRKHKGKEYYINVNKGAR